MVPGFTMRCIVSSNSPPTSSFSGFPKNMQFFEKTITSHKQKLSRCEGMCIERRFHHSKALVQIYDTDARTGLWSRFSDFVLVWNTLEAEKAHDTYRHKWTRKIPPEIHRETCLFSCMGRFAHPASVPSNKGKWRSLAAVEL